MRSSEDKCIEKRKRPRVVHRATRVAPLSPRRSYVTACLLPPPPPELPIESPASSKDGGGGALLVFSFSSWLLPSPFLLHSFPSFLLAPVAVGACLELVADLRAWPPDPCRRSLDLLSAGGSTQIRWWAAGCGLGRRRWCAGPRRLQLEAYTRRLLCIGPGGDARRRWWRRSGAPCLTMWRRRAASSSSLCCPR